MEDFKEIEVGKIIMTYTFEEGDCICHVKNWQNGMPLFFRASDDDVKKYSNSASTKDTYLKLVITE